MPPALLPALFNTDRAPPAHRCRSHQAGRIGTLGLVLLAALVCAAVAAVFWWRGGWPAGVGPGGRLTAAAAAAQPAASTPASTASAARSAGGRPSTSRGGPYGGDRAQPVSVGVVQRRDMREVVDAIGTVTAFNTVTVRSRVDGELRAIQFKEGQQVKAGQVLAEIDPRALQAALAQTQGQMAKDQATLRNAQVDLKRYKDLLAKDSIARQQVDTQASLVGQLQGSLAVNQAAVDSAKLQLSYTKITAPIGGRLGLRQVDVGNMLRASDANGIVSITQTRPISVTFAVPESKLAQINAKLRAGAANSDTKKQPAALPVELWDREQRNKLATGAVSAIDNAVDAATGTIKVKARFDNDDDALFPNQFVNIRLTIDVLDNALIVPTNAIQRGAVGTYVYRVQPDKTVSVRKVETGVTDADWVAVKGDLAAGDQVVTDGADRLREGAKIEPILPNGEAAATEVANAGATDGRPAWMDRLPPDQVEKIKAMNPEERRAHLRKLREQRGSGSGGGGGN